MPTQDDTSIKSDRDGLDLAFEEMLKKLREERTAENNPKIKFENGQAVIDFGEEKPPFNPESRPK